MVRFTWEDFTPTWFSCPTTRLHPSGAFQHEPFVLASFITGQHGMQTGFTKVGLPGAKAGLFKEDPTIATSLKALGYATSQFGKNHLGDRNEYLPTVHGFDEFYGNLYHLNAEEEPEHGDYPKDPAFRVVASPEDIQPAT